MDPYVTILLSLIAAGAGAYFGAYLRQKGQNLATHEDLKPLTRAVEEIKSEISGRQWRQQRAWDLKVEKYVAMLEHLAEMGVALRGLVISSYNKAIPEAQRAPARVFLDRLSPALAQFRRASSVGRIVFSLPARRAINVLGETWEAKWTTEEDAVVLAELADLVQRTYDELLEHARRDLGEE